MFFFRLFFQNFNRISMIKLGFYHDKIISLLIFFRILVGRILFFTNFIEFFRSEYIEHHKLEFLWTIFPAIILLFLSFPSMKALYFLDEVIKSSITLKIIGHQWYWSYEYCDLHIKYDRFIKQIVDLKKGEFRLLEASTNIILFSKVITQILTTSIDVIHSWTVPVLGIKLDAMPGRLRQAACFPLYRGVFYGQCSEICGVNHSFMPVKLEIFSAKELKKFL